MKNTPSTDPAAVYLAAVEAEIATTPMLQKGCARNAHAIRDSLLALAGAAAAEHYLATGGTVDENGFTDLPGGPATASLDASRKPVWRGRSYCSTAAEIGDLRDDAAALLLGTPWIRTSWERGRPTAKSLARTSSRWTTRTSLLDPEVVETAAERTDGYIHEHQPNRPAEDYLRETDVFLLTTFTAENPDTGTSDLYRFNDDPHEDGTDPDRGYSRVPAGPLITELTEWIDRIIRWGNTSGQDRTRDFPLR